MSANIARKRFEEQIARFEYILKHNNLQPGVVDSIWNRLGPMKGYLNQLNKGRDISDFMIKWLDENEKEDSYFSM